MPFLGAGIHILIALYFAVHAVRSGQHMYWLFILFSFPLLGSAVYFFVIYLPQSGLDRGARRAVTLAAKSIDPGRELREARDAFDYTPTAQNQMRLARALLESGAAQEAATHYEACLKGPLSGDTEISWCAAQAHMESGQYGRAIERLQAIRAANPQFRAQAVSLALARSLAGAGRHDEARAEFDEALSRHGGFEVSAEYAIWALARGDRSLADKLQADIDQATKRWNRQTRELHRSLLQRLADARSAAQRI